MVNVPPVAGMRETSPRAVENVERSSCAYCDEEMDCKKLRKIGQRGWDIGIMIAQSPKNLSLILMVDRDCTTIANLHTRLSSSTCIAHRT
jgi:hypothetical protein